MKEHLILTGTDEQITRSKTLNSILINATENDESLSIVNYLGDKSIDEVFDPSNFSLTSKTVLVYTNGRPFDYIDFYLFHATNYFFTVNAIDFVFIAPRNPFSQTTQISKRFKVIDITKKDGDLNCKSFEILSTQQLDNKTESLLQMIDSVQGSNNYSVGEKTLLCDYFKKLVLETHVKRLAYVDNSTESILSQIN